MNSVLSKPQHLKWTVVGTPLALGVLLVVFTSCDQSSSKDASLRAWRASDSSIESRVAAVSKLLPKGTRVVEALKLLGEPTNRESWRGPSTIDGKVSEMFIEQYGTNYGAVYDLVYEFPAKGAVCLRFDMSASPTKWENWPLVRVWSRQTNSFQLIPFTKDEKKQ